MIEPIQYQRHDHMNMESSKPSANQPQPQAQWVKHSTLRFFKGLDQILNFPVNVALTHDATTKILRSQWEVVSRDVHYITLTARRLLAEEVSTKIYKEEEILKAEKEVFKVLEGAHEYFDTRITQAEQKLREAGMSELALRGGNVARLYEARSTTRTATKWLELLQKADNYLTLNYQLWVTGEIGPSSWTEDEALAAMQANIRDTRTTITTLARRINQQYTNIRALVQRVQDQRRADDEARRRAQSERDRAKHKASLQAVEKEKPAAPAKQTPAPAASEAAAA